MSRTKKGKKTSASREQGRTMLQEVYDAHAVVLENIDGKIDALVEGFTSLNDRIARLDERLIKVEKHVDQMSIEMTFVKEELRLIRYELKEKASWADLHALEKRVTHIERQLAKRQEDFKSQRL